MPDQSAAISDLGGVTPTPAPFKKGDVVDVNVWRDNASGMFNGLVPKFILQVYAAGTAPKTWQLCEVGTSKVTIPACPEELMKKV